MARPWSASTISKVRNRWAASLCMMGEDTHFIKSDLPGYQRPYARYAGDGRTIHVSFTDAHPRNFGNGIYYAAFRDRAFFRADGSKIKDLAAGPLTPSEAEIVFQGSGVGTDGRAEGNAPKAAWTSSMAIDSAGRPHIAYSLFLSNSDHRYRLASWDGQKWVDREIAYAGNCLYPKEASYTGLITLDPVDPTVVCISTDANPSTGAPASGMHEIYRASVAPNDDIKTINWEAVTRGSKVANLRPIIVREGKQRVVLWCRGVFKTYTDYDLEAVGFVEATE